MFLIVWDMIGVFFGYVFMYGFVNLMGVILKINVLKKSSFFMMWLLILFFGLKEGFFYCLVCSIL